MKQLKLVNASLVQAGMALLLTIPQISVADVMSDLATYQNELDRTQAFTNDSAKNPELEGQLNLLKSIPKIQELTGKANNWRKVKEDYNKLVQRGKDRLQKEVTDRLAKSDKDAKAWKSMPQGQGAQIGMAMQQMLNGGDMPQECKADFNAGMATQAFTELDKAATNARQNGEEMAKEDKEKAQKEFNKTLALELQKSLGGGDVDEQTEEKARKLRELLTTIKDPKAFTKLAEMEFKKEKDGAKAVEVAAKLFYLDPENGLLARLEKMKQGDERLAEIAAQQTQFIQNQSNMALMSFSKIMDGAKTKCTTLRNSIPQKREAVLVGLQNFNANAQPGGEKFSDQALQAEEGRWTSIEGSLTCNFQDAETMLTQFAGTVSNSVNEINNETKSPRKLRDAIANALSSIPNMGMQLADATKTAQQGCKVAAEAIQKLEQDSMRSSFVKSKGGGAGGSFAGGGVPRRGGRPSAAPAGGQSTHGGV